MNEENQETTNSEDSQELSGLEKPEQTTELPTENSNSENNTQQTETVPETYDFKDVALPDGMELDKELTDEFSGIAKEMGLTQGKANQFMELGVKLSTKVQQKFESAIKEYQENQIKAIKQC